MPLQSDALVTLEQMRDFLQQDLEDRAREVERYINAATETIHGYTKRKLRSRTYTNVVLDGHGGHRLLVPEWPVTTLTSVQFLLSTLPDAWDPQDATEFVVVQPALQMIERRDGSWPRSTQSIRMTWVGGLLTVPDDLVVAACMVVKHLMGMPDYQFQHVDSISSQGTTTVFRHDAIPPQAVPTLSRYRRKEL